MRFPSTPLGGITNCRAVHSSCYRPLRVLPPHNRYMPFRIETTISSMYIDLARVRFSWSVRPVPQIFCFIVLQPVPAKPSRSGTGPKRSINPSVSAMSLVQPPKPPTRKTGLRDSNDSRTSSQMSGNPPSTWVHWRAWLGSPRVCTILWTNKSQYKRRPPRCHVWSCR